MIKITGILFIAAWCALLPHKLVASPRTVEPVADWGQKTSIDGKDVPFSKYLELHRIEYIPTNLQGNPMIMAYVLEGDISLKQMTSEKMLSRGSFEGNLNRISGSTVTELGKGEHSLAQWSRPSMTYTDVTTIRRKDLGDRHLVIFKKERLNKGDSKPIFETSIAIPVEINQWIAFKMPYQITPFTEWFFIKYKAHGTLQESDFL